MAYHPQLLADLSQTERHSAGIFLIRLQRDQRVYIGAARHLGQACARTRHELRQGRHACRQLQAYATAHGLAGLRFEVLERCSVDELPAAKLRQVAAHRATNPAHGFNTLATVGFALGQPLSAEHRARISAGKRGRPIAPRTAEHQEKIAAAHRGRQRSPQACANMRGPRKPRSPRVEEPPPPGPKLSESPE